MKSKSNKFPEAELVDVRLTRHACEMCECSVCYKSETFQRDFQNQKRRVLSLLTEKMGIKTGNEFFRKSHNGGFICLCLAFLSMMTIRCQVGGCQLCRQGASSYVNLRFSRDLLHYRGGESEPRGDSKQQHLKETSTRATMCEMCVYYSAI